MQEYSITATGNGTTNWVRMDTRGNTIHVYHVAIVFESEEAGTADLEIAIETDLDNATPICHHILRGVTSTTLSTIEAPIAGLRLNVGDYVNKSITLKVLQS
jgi:hypothetical protein